MKKKLSKYKHLISYLVWGGMAALVSVTVFDYCIKWTNLSASASNIVAWLVSMIFAFFANKIFVFKDKSWDGWFLQFGKFAFGRLGSGLLETLLIYLLIEELDFSPLPVKIILTVFVAIFNYVLSKFFVFND